VLGFFLSYSCSYSYSYSVFLSMRLVEDATTGIRIASAGDRTTSDKAIDKEIKV